MTTPNNINPERNYGHILALEEILQTLLIELEEQGIAPKAVAKARQALSEFVDSPLYEFQSDDTQLGFVEGGMWKVSRPRPEVIVVKSPFGGDKNRE